MPLKEHGLVAVVDDDSSMLNALRRLLVVHRFQVETFASAEELLQSPVLDRIACVVSDVDLRDGMSGLALGETMFARGHATPIIFMTGSADSDVRRRALALGCSAFLEKPFSAETLVESVVKAITGPK
jgi:FixJ family two-component response regulator